MAPPMEGVESGGQGMVAIIQGLRETGLAVTLMSPPRIVACRARSKRAPAARASVHTNTEPGRRAHAQIWDAHYASSYQLAHCRVPPSPPSPPPPLPEFPEQRGTPSRTRGNFRVGRCSGREEEPHRGSPRSPCPSPGDSFMDSLRKYPLGPGAGASISSELVQRLLNYTQTKHLSKSTTRSIRSMFSPRSSYKKCNKTNKANNKPNKAVNKCTNKPSVVNNASKNIQTYTRAVSVDEEDIGAEKRKKKKAGVDVALSTNRLGQCIERSPSLRWCRAPSRGYPGRGSEVRYLSDVRRVIRDTIKQMVEATEPVPCTNAKCRYREHRRMHHHSDTATSPVQNESEATQKDDQLNASYDYLKASPCDRSSYSDRGPEHAAGQCAELCIDEVRKYIRQTVKQMVDCSRNCPKKMPICKDKRLQCFKDKSRTAISEGEEEDENEEFVGKRHSHCKVDARTSDSDVCPGPKADVCPNVMHRYRQHRQKYHDEHLGDDDDDDSEEERDKPPEKCHPPAGTKSSLFSLKKPCICDKEKEIAAKSRYGVDGWDSLDDVLIYVDDDDIDIEEQVMNWVKQLPAYTNNTEENQAKILEMAHDLIEKLNALKGRPNYDEKALEEIKEFLDQIPYPVDGRKGGIGEEEDEDLDELRDIISRWLDCLHLDPRDKTGKTELIKEFVDHLLPMIEKNEVPENFKQKILALVHDVEQNKHIPHFEDIDEHTDDLVDELHYMALRRQERKHQRIRQKFLEPIMKWLMENKNVPKELKEKHRDSASKTDAKLRQMVASGASKESMAGEIDNFFKSIPEDELKLNPKLKSQLSQNFIKDMQYGLSPMTNENKEKAAYDLLRNITSKPGTKMFQSKNPVSDWLENNPYIEEEDKENNRKLAKQFDEKLKEMKSDNVNGDAIENEINKFLDSLSEKGLMITPEQRTALINKIRNEITSVPSDKKKVPSSYKSAQPTSNWLENEPNISKQVKQKNKQSAKEFDKKLQRMKSENVGDDVIEDEIYDFLESLARKGIPLTPKQNSDIARNILEELKSLGSSKDQSSKRTASDWLKNVPNVPKQIKEKNQKEFNLFEKKIQQMKAKNVDDDVIQDEINEFMDSLPEKGIKVTRPEKDALARTLFKEEPTLSKVRDKKPTADWFNNAKNIPEQIKQKNQILVKNFDEKLQEMKSQAVEDDVIEDEIGEFLDTLSRKGVTVSPKQKNEITRSILNGLKSTPTIDRSTKGNTSKQPASEWLNSAPNIPQQIKEKNKSAFESIENKIQQMKDKNVDDDTIQDEINEFIDSLPQKGIKMSSSQKKVLAKTMLKAQSKPSTNIQQSTAEWLENAPNISKQVKEKNKNIARDLDEKLQEMKFQNVGDDVIEDEINEFLNALSRKGVPLSAKQKGEIARNILKELMPTSVTSQQSKQPLTDRSGTASNIPKQVKDLNKPLFDNFEKKIQLMKARNVDNGVIQDEIKEFVDSLPDKGVKVSPKQKKELTDTMLKQASDLTEDPKRQTVDRPGKIVTSTPKQAKQQKLQPLSDWLENAPNISKQIKEKNRNLVKNFDDKLKQMKSQYADDDDIQEEINDVLDSLTAKGIPLSAKQKSELARNTFNQLKSSPSESSYAASSSKQPSPDEQFRKNAYDVNKKNQPYKSTYMDEDDIDKFASPIPKKRLLHTPNQENDQIRNVLKGKPEMSQVGYSSTPERCDITSNVMPASDWLETSSCVPKEVKLKNRKFVKKFDEQLNKLKSDRASDHAIENRIKQFLGDLPEKGISVPRKEKDRLRKSLLDIHKRPSKSRIRPVSRWLDSSANIPDNVKKDTRDLVEHFDDKLYRLRAGNATEAEIQEEIQDFLDTLNSQGVGMSQAEKAQLLKKFLAESRTMLDTLSRSNLHKDDLDDDEMEDDSKSNKLLSLNPKEKQDLKGIVNGTILDFIEDTTGDHSPVTRFERSKTTDPLSSKLTNIMTDPKDKHRDEHMLDEINQYLNKEPIDTDIPNEELAVQLKEELDKIDFATSTPYKKGGRFFGSGLSAISFDGSIDSLRKRSPSTLQHDLEKILGKWLDDTHSLSRPDKNKFSDKIPQLAKNITKNMQSSEDANLFNSIYDALKPCVRSVNRNIGDEELLKMAKEIEQALNKQGFTESSFMFPNGSKSKLSSGLRRVTSQEQIARLLNAPDKFIRDAVNRWANTLTLPGDKNIVDKAKENLVKDLTNTFVSYSGRIPTEKEDKIFQNAVSKFLDEVPDHDYTPADINPLADSLKKMFYESAKKYAELPSEGSATRVTSPEQIARLLKTPDKFIRDAVNRWASTLTLPVDKNIIEKAKDNLVKDLTNTFVSHNGRIPTEKKDKIFQNAVSKFLDDVPEHEYTPVDINPLADSLKNMFYESAKKYAVLPSEGSATRVTSPEQIARLLKTPDKFIRDAVNRWASTLTLPVDKNTVEKAKDNLVKDLTNTFVSHNGRIPTEKEDKIFQNAVSKFLDDIPEHGYTPVDINPLADSLKKMFYESAKKYAELPSEGSATRVTSPEQIARLLKTPDKFIRDAVNRWASTLTLPVDKNTVEKAKDNLVKNLTNTFISHNGRIPTEKEDKIFQNAVAQFLDEAPGHDYTSNDINPLADSLKKTFYESAKKFAEDGLASKKGADVMLDEISAWVENLPIESNTLEEKENADKQKQEIKAKIIHKIGELNMNPEIFNDDLLYEDMLEDEVEGLLLNTGSESVKRQLPKLVKSFLDIIRRGREKIRDENAGQVYKQQLKDAMSRTLPSFEFTSPEGRASLDVLKDDIVDDFINMHYVDNNTCEINRLKEKINGDLYDFCMRHLRRCPATPLNTSQLNEDLLKALESVPPPLTESFKDEVELVKLKEVINDWLVDLPLIQQSGLKKLQTNKMAVVLAKKLHDIENELLGAEEHDDKMKKEILKFLNKLPLASSREDELERYAEDLIQRLKETEEFRKLDASHRHCINPPCFRPCTFPPPPCTLSQDDLDHLERIRQRNKVRRKISFRDACLSPCAVNISTQTEFTSPMDFSGQVMCRGLGRMSSSAQTLCRRMQAVGSQVSPNVIVSEHHWDSCESSMPLCGAPIARRSTCVSPRRSQSPNRPCPRPEYESTSSQMQYPCPQTRPAHLEQRQPSFQEPQEYQPPPQIPRAQLCSRPTQYTQEALQQSIPLPQICMSHRSTQNIPQRSRDDSYLSEPCQADFSQNQRRPATARPCQRTSSTTGPRNLRENGFTICNPCPESGGQERRACTESQSNQRGSAPCVSSPRQRPGPSYYSPQTSEHFSSSQDQPCYSQPPYFMSSTTPISSEDFVPGCFQNRVTRVTHLGSFDHSDRLRMSRLPKCNLRADAFDYWDTEYRSSPSDRSEECRKRCRCKPKCGKYKGRRRPRHLANDEAMSSCARCCGVHCPYPTYMFFG